MFDDFYCFGRICGGINATFIPLIPKVERAKNVKDFRPIRLTTSLDRSSQRFCLTASRDYSVHHLLATSALL